MVIRFIGEALFGIQPPRKQGSFAVRVGRLSYIPLGRSISCEESLALRQLFFLSILSSFVTLSCTRLKVDGLVVLPSGLLSACLS
jgi:hypothetical protein